MRIAAVRSHIKPSNTRVQKTKHEAAFYLWFKIKKKLNIKQMRLRNKAIMTHSSQHLCQLHPKNYLEYTL